MQNSYKGMSTQVPETGLHPETGDFVSGKRKRQLCIRKQDTLYPEAGDCCQKRQQSRLFPDTKYPVSGYKFAVSDNEVA